MKTIAWLILGGLCGGVLANDPFAADEGAKLKEVGTAQTNIDLVYEVFSLSMAKGADLLRRDLSDGELYEVMVEGVKAGEVGQQVFQSVVSRSGEEVILLDVEEFIYPTEFEPCEGVENPPTMEAYDEWFVSPSPSAFDTRYLGLSLYVTPSAWSESGLVALDFSATAVDLAGLEEWGLAPSTLTMANFEVRSLRSIVLAWSGEAALAGVVKGREGEGVNFTFVTANVEGAKLEKEELRVGRVKYEVFSLGLAEAAEMRRLGRADEVIYEGLVDGVKEGAVRLEKLLGMPGVSGMGAVVEQVKEYIYPSEYDPPGFGNQLVPMPVVNVFNWRRFPAVTSAFDTKSVGDYLEMEMQWGEGGVVDCRIDAVHVELLGRHSYGKRLARYEQPEFGLGRVRTGFSVRTGVPSLVGTVTSANEVGRVWWAFLTVSGNE